MGKRSANTPRTSLRVAGVIGAVLSLGLAGSAVAWAQLTEINGAVIASGSVVVRGKPKSVQHLDGGIVDAIDVGDGDRVEAGDVLVRLDSTLLEANLAIYRTRLIEAHALRDRLRAELTGVGTLDFSGLPDELGNIDDLTAIRDGQRAIFEARRDVRAGQVEQLQERAEQFRNQTRGIERLVAAKQQQLTLLEREIAGIETLNRKGLAPETRLMAMQRDRADVLGQLGEHRAEVSRIANSVRDTELQVLQITRQVREESAMALRDVEKEMEELNQQLRSTARQLERVEIRAPVGGIVHELQVTTLGGVVAPGGLVTQIIERDAGVVFDMRVPTAAVDQVYVGQGARIVMSAFNQRTTPELAGTVARISPDAVLDEATGQPFFRVQLSVTPAELDRLGDLAIVPGMPVEAFLQTGERSVLSYLVRPLTDQIDRAFREE